MDNEGGEKRPHEEQQKIDGDSLEEGETGDMDAEPSTETGATGPLEQAMVSATVEPPKLSPKTVSNHNYGIMSLGNGAIRVRVPMNDDYYWDPGVKKPDLPNDALVDAGKSTDDVFKNASPLKETRHRSKASHQAGITHQVQN